MIPSPPPRRSTRSAALLSFALIAAASLACGVEEQEGPTPNLPNAVCRDETVDNRDRGVFYDQSTGEQLGMCGLNEVCAQPETLNNTSCKRITVTNPPPGSLVCRDETVNNRPRGVYYDSQGQPAGSCPVDQTCASPETPDNTTCRAISPLSVAVCRDETVDNRDRGVFYDPDTDLKVGQCPTNEVCANPETRGDITCRRALIESTEVCLDTPIDSRLQGNIHKGGTGPQFIVRACPEGFVCAQPGNPDDLTCLTTVQDESSPWAKYPCFVNRDRPKTAFDMDCRCTLNFTISSPLRMCLRPYRLTLDDQADLRAGVYGQGPHVYEFGEFAEQRGGFMNAATREIFLAGRFRAGDDDLRGARKGFVMAINIDSGDRRIISGDYSDGDGVLKNRGQGPGFWDAWKVLPGPDGALYVFDYLGTGNAQILRVDPQTGDRTFIWTNEDPEQVDPTLGVCDHGSTNQAMRQRVAVPIDGGNPSFAIDPQGRFYMAFNQAGFGTGVGLIRVGADGKSCEYFSRTGAAQGNIYRGQDIGQGASFGQGALSGLSITGDTLYALNFINGTAYAVKLASGDRSIASSGTTAVAYTVINPHDPNELWAIGKDTTTVIDLIRLQERDIADLWTLDTFKRGPLNAGNLGSGGFWFDPTNPDIAYFSHDNWAIVKAELSTFNNYIISL